MAFLYVKVYYGPCYTFQNNIHKPQVLYGMRDHLQKLGYRVDLIPVEFANYCMLEMCGNEIFRCNIKQLKFNTALERDVVCQRAVEAVINSSLKFRRACPYFWLWTLIDQLIFKRGKYAPTNFWVPGTEEKTFECTTCLNCCNLDPTETEDLLRQ